ncbi:MAG: tetratricopeptide repeat protein [Ignavibacteriaceae bacterium]
MIKKKNIFRVILFLIPFLFLFSLEIILRLIGYGPDLSIVAKIQRNGKEYYTMNQLVGNRYFNENRLFYRKGSHDFFEVNKSPNTIRVFCFGASTMAGFPYEYDAIPSEFLRDRLIDAFPYKNIEVINTAIAATNSYTVSEFVNELSHYKPDLFIIYMGQNEFYGAFGVGSTISIGKSRWLIKTFLWLQQFKTFLFLKNIVSSISNYFKPSNVNEDKILMEQMVKNNSIKYNGSDFLIAENTFEDNYQEVIETAKKNKIPVIISTLVTNEKDLAPFVSIYSDNLNDSLKNKFNNYLAAGINYRKKGDYTNALKSFNKSIAIDSTPADVHYQIGVCEELTKNYEKAKRQFTLAKNLDGLRFRAPSVFNRVIRKLSNQYKVPLSDVNKSFQGSSPYGIIGKELLVDHVHPNIKGYFLLAKTWFQTIRDNELVGLSANVNENDSLLWQQSSVTTLDSIIGALKIMKLKSRPPFTNKDSDFVFTPHNNLEQIAYNYLTNNKLSWGMAHVMAAKEYLVKKDYEKALREYKAILITDETNPNLLSIIGDIYYQLKSYQEAEANYYKAFSFDSNQFLKYRLGLANINLKKPDLAVQYFSSCLLDNKSSNQFTVGQVENIRYNLAVAYSRTNQNEKAIDELSIILKTNPLNTEAATLFKKLKQ